MPAGSNRYINADACYKNTEHEFNGILREFIREY